jgi:8-oxo-dGTP pyrophosphatase MutT (NUDIX family)
VTPDGRVLVLRGHDPALPSASYWFTIGGGVEPGETITEAAVREMREETGISISPDLLGTPFHAGHHDYTYDGVQYRSHSTFFAVGIEEVAAVLDGVEEGEIVTDARWMRPADLLHEVCSNRRLPDLVAQAVRHVRRDVCR